MLNWLLIFVMTAGLFSLNLHAQSDDWESYETAQVDDVEVPDEEESDEDMPPVPPTVTKEVPPPTEDGEVESDEGY
jgi:hypothetical protein